MRDLLAVMVLVLTGLTRPAVPAMAQTRAAAADLTGQVLDESKAVVPGVAIKVTNPETGGVRTAVTGADGRFLVPALPVGTYAVRAEFSGLAVEDTVVLTVGSAVDVSMILRAPRIEEAITVVAGGSSLVDIQKTAVASVVSQHQIDSLPINGRNFISFAVITPGVNTDRSTGQGVAATSGLVFAGQRPRSNNITVDGLDNNDATVGSVRATFSQEAIREFQVLTNSYSAEFGKAAGGVLNIVTRSGTNAFAGNAFFYFRNKSLNSAGYFERFDPAGTPIDLPKTPYDQKQFGGTLGGPLKKDRSFFFVSVERLDIDAANLVTIDDTTSVADPGGEPLGTPVEILRRAGFPIETGQVPFSMNGSQFLAKVDHRLTASQQLVARFNYAGTLDENVEPWGGLVAKSRGGALDASDYTVAVSHTTMASTMFINEARAQYTLRDQTVNALDPRCLGPCTREDQGGPTLVVSGVGFAGRHLYAPGPRVAGRFQALDTLSYYAGRHQLKTGFDVSFIDTTARLPLGFGGQFVFAALPAIPGVSAVPVSAIQALALGIPVAYFQGYGNSDASYPYQDLSLFGQDDWTVKTNLTVKIGLRYQMQFWPDLAYDVPGIPAYTFPRDRNDVAPRLSVAWDPARGKKTVLRAAYGLFHDNNVTGIVGSTKALNGTTGVRAVTAALPSPIPIMAWNSPRHRIDEPPSQEVPSVVVTVDPALKTAYTHHASAGVDHEAPRNFLLSASIVYARGFNFLGAIDYNPLVWDLGPGRRPEDVGGRAGTSASISQYTSYGQTWYRGLILSVSKRQAANQMLASYTLSKAEDNATDYIGGPENNGKGRNLAAPTGLPIDFDPTSERGPSVHDQRHRFVLSGTYGLPGRIQISSIVKIGSGWPHNLLAGVDFNRDGMLSDRPRTNPLSAPSDYSSTVGRNTGTMPAEATVDLRVQKRLTLKSKAYAEAMFEVFNLFNRTNFTQVNSTFGPGVYPDLPLPTSGQFTKAGPPRQIQLALKASF